jgi:hypothetical protein
MLGLHDTIVSPREYYFVAAFRSSPVDCSSIVVVLKRGRVELLSSCYNVLCNADFCGRIDGAKRQNMTSVGEVTTTVWRENVFLFFLPPCVIEPSLALLLAKRVSRPLDRTPTAITFLFVCNHNR